jgi:hypothetical protein
MDLTPLLLMIFGGTNFGSLVQSRTLVLSYAFQSFITEFVTKFTNK